MARAVERLIEYEGAGEAEVAAALFADGMTLLEAYKVVALVPLAFGRVMLRKFPIQFSPLAMMQDSPSSAPRKVILADDPIFAEATRFAEQAYKQGTHGGARFGAVVSRSAEVGALGEAFGDGASPDEIEFSPPQITLW